MGENSRTCHLKQHPFIQNDTCQKLNPYKPGILFMGHEASHLGLFYLLTRMSSKNEIILLTHHLIKMGKSFWLIWVN